MYSKHLIHNNLKKHYLALFLIVITVRAFGQSNFYNLSLGGGVGGTYSFTDVQKGGFALGYVGNLDYHFSPFITAGIELQKGTIKGGGNGGNTPDEHGRVFTNSYMAYNVNFKFRAGQITDFYYSDFLNYTKGFYLGTGVGMINNSVKNITSKAAIDGNGNPYTYDFPLADKKSNMVVPLNIGIDFYFPDGWGDIRYIFNVNYQANWTFGEGLDGYDDTKTIRRNVGSAPDIYNFLSVGFKYTFGPKGLTGKSIR